MNRNTSDSWKVTLSRRADKQAETGLPWRGPFKELVKKYTERGALLRGGRHKAGLTQKELADKLGILPHHIGEMEHGKRAICKKMAQKLGRIFQVDYRVFL